MRVGGSGLGAGGKLENKTRKEGLEFECHPRRNQGQSGSRELNRTKCDLGCGMERGAQLDAFKQVMGLENISTHALWVRSCPLSLHT